MAGSIARVGLRIVLAAPMSALAGCRRWVVTGCRLFGEEEAGKPEGAGR